MNRLITHRGYISLFIPILIILSISTVLIISLAKNTEKRPKRVTYDFNKFSTEDFIVFKSQKIGFALRHPKEMKVYYHNPSENNNYLYNDLKFTEYINLSLTSQLAEGVELFDGLSIDIYYYQNQGKLTIESAIPKMDQNEYPREGDIILKEDLFINKIKITKALICCWGGGHTDYYFTTENGNWFIIISIFSAGPDKEKFIQLADKILQSLELFN